MTKALSLITLATFLLSSCATILEGTREKVVFTSNPSGANVRIDGKDMGATPFYTKLNVRKNYVVQFYKDSAMVTTVPINRKIQKGYLFTEIALAHTFYLSPLVVVDAISGAWFKLDKNYIHVDYDKEKTIE